MTNSPTPTDATAPSGTSGTSGAAVTPLRILVVGAAGQAGRRITADALSRGHAVTGVVRRDGVDLGGAQVLLRDLFDLSAQDVAGADVVVDAFGTFDPELLHQHGTSLAHLADLVAGTDTRLIVVGSAGSLLLPDGTRLVDSPAMPAQFKPLATAMADAFDALRARQDVRWTYVSPAIDFQPDGPATGTYRVGGDALMMNAAGESVLSYADFATAVVDEAEAAAHVGERISVVSV
ncbi:NADH-flavin reductase [Corynebacterium sp. 13CS0277]|uniref:NAD(P)-dependent oxidoreductase n=1 Tax=Corynebacterium sp. 13CS0277 TaxID=2071994 RepID=UPI000D02D00C|nr:NAD(P)H-binding protein [Corynebacterium sp. 13CS0277]PRQ11639.1 NADH-flavin reductase [Corynebacterium sp. 13CS0277]